MEGVCYVYFISMKIYQDIPRDILIVWSRVGRFHSRFARSPAPAKMVLRHHFRMVSNFHVLSPNKWAYALPSWGRGAEESRSIDWMIEVLRNASIQGSLSGSSGKIVVRLIIAAFVDFISETAGPDTFVDINFTLKYVKTRWRVLMCFEKLPVSKWW